jgi:ribonuclease R
MTEKIIGRIDGTKNGYAFLVPDDKQKPDYFISKSDLKGAFHNDRVEALVEEYKGKTCGRVLKIIERGNDTIVGTYRTNRRGGFLSPDDPKFNFIVSLPFGKGQKAKSGDKVVCKILSYPKNSIPEGIVVKILGKEYTRRAEVDSIIYSYGINDAFPKSVIEYANSFPNELSKKDYENRRDLREEIIFTIDGDDSRDFDDAVSITKTEKGYVLGVHIADVSHYVKYNAIIDCEAQKRLTSIYFPEKVVPMLPEKLSNGLCSLNPNEDRLALSCVMTVDFNGKVIDNEIFTSIIKSVARTTYKNVEKVIIGDYEKDIFGEKTDLLVEKIYLMNELCDILLKVRDEKGSINFDLKESTISVVNEEVVVSQNVRLKSQKIIEEFMILANVTVAEYLGYLSLPCMYRVHGEPTQEKLEIFYSFLNSLGVKYSKKRDEIYPKDFQKILKAEKDKPYFSVINKVMLRTMQKAKYSPENVGHFGLSEKNYCHFTSPIRRYPDLMVHRVLKDFLDGKDVVKKYASDIKSLANLCSEKERNAEEAERAVDDYYKVEYMSDKIGNEYDGVISGVTSFGIFVETDFGVEGLVRIENLPGNRFVFNERNFTLSNGRTTYKLCQKVKIKVMSVDYGSRRIDFNLI